MKYLRQSILGDVLGKASYQIYGSTIDIDLIAANSIEEDPPFSILDFLLNLLIILLKIFAILVVFILIIRFYNKVIRKSAKKRRSARTKRYNARFHK
jgi:hypothetical protein